MRISDWSSDVCSSDLAALRASRRPLSRAPQHEDASFCHQKIHLILRSMAGLLARPCVSKDARVPLQYFEITSGQRAPEAEGDRKSARLNSRHECATRMPPYAC